MEKNLEENGIIDETQEFEQYLFIYLFIYISFRLEIPESEWYIPAIHLYFNDDLTVA
jgi:hypothetical protein